MDYPPSVAGSAAYSTVDKNQNKLRESGRSYRSHNDYPDVINGVSCIFSMFKAPALEILGKNGGLRPSLPTSSACTEGCA